MKKQIYLSLLAILISLTANAQRDVYWVHGLGKTGTFWQSASDSLTDDAETRYVTYRPEWDSRQSIEDIARTLNTNELDNATRSTRSVILIGHSTGGLIARSMRRLRDVAGDNPGKISAIITVGTPNQGAGIADALFNGSYKNLFKEASDKAYNTIDNTAAIIAEFSLLTVGPVATITAVAILYNKVTSTLNSMASELDSYVKQQYTSDLTVADMETTSSYIREMKASISPVPIVNIIGKEDDWQAVRLASSLNSPTDDEIYVRELQKISSTMDQVADGILGIAIALEASTLGLAYITGVSRKYWEAIESWRDLKRYVNIDIHTRWSELIGATHTETKTTTTTTPYTPPGDPNSWTDDDINSDRNREDRYLRVVPIVPDNLWESVLPNTEHSTATYTRSQPQIVQTQSPVITINTQTTVQTIVVNENHDGLISNHHSRINEHMGVYVRNIEVQHVNHMEMNSHKEVWNQLNNLLTSDNDNNIIEDYGSQFNPLVDN